MKKDKNNELHENKTKQKDFDLAQRENFQKYFQLQEAPTKASKFLSILCEYHAEMF